MKALYFDEHGGPEVMQYGDLPDPTPGPGQVRVRVKAVALNHLDLWVRRGGPAFERLPKPHVGGCDVSGVVESYGPDASGPAAGARVAVDPGLSTKEDEWTRRGEDSVSPGYVILGEHSTGGAAEYVVVPASNLLSMPDHVSHEAAAAASLAGLTAWRLLVHRAQLKPGETIAIVGAGGGVNHLAVQVAKCLGATVYAITSSKEKMEKARALGADYAINYKAEDWSKAVFAATGKRGVDVVVDNVGAKTWAQSLRAAARGGRIVTVGGTTGYDPPAQLNQVFWKQLTIVGSTMGDPHEFDTVMDLVFRGRLLAVIDRVYGLDEGVEAYKRLAEGAALGKVLVQP